MAVGTARFWNVHRMIFCRHCRRSEGGGKRLDMGSARVIIEEIFEEGPCLAVGMSDLYDDDLVYHKS
jgi:hypothetical protein